MTDFTPKQVRLFGDKHRSGELAGVGYKLLGKLKEFMLFRNLLVAGPWTASGPGWQVVVKSLAGVRDYVDVYTTSHEIERVALRETSVDKMLIFWGYCYERLDFTYKPESALFLPGDVTCTDGSGTVEQVSGSYLVGMFTRCWDGGMSVVQGLAAGVIRTCRREWFADTYQTRELFAPFDFSTVAENTLSPSDELNLSCRMNAGNKSFSKTLGKLTVQAFEYGDRTFSLTWMLCAKYKGKQVIFPDGNPSFTASDFTRTGLYMKGIYTYLQVYEVLFDCWEENGKLYMGACGQSTLHVWEVDEDGNAVISYTHRLAGKAFEGTVPSNYRPMVCGYTEHTAFINRGGYGIVLETKDGGVAGTNGTAEVIEKTIWNHLNDTLYYWEDGRQTVVNVPYAYATLADFCILGGYTGVWCHCGCGDPDSCAQYPLPCPPLKGDLYVHCYDYAVAGTSGASICVTITWGWIMGTSVDRYITSHYTVNVYKKVVTTYGEYNIVALKADGKPNDYATFNCGQYSLTTGGWYSYSGLNWLSDFSGSLLCACYTSRTGYSLNDWGITPDGLAYRVGSQKIDWCGVGLDDSCSADNVTLRGGERDVLFLAYDEWEAFLKRGIDANNQTLTAPAFIFRVAENDQLCLYSGEALEMELLGNGDRAFFQYVADMAEEE